MILTDDGSAGTGLYCHGVTPSVATAALDATAMQHGDTQYHTLLQYQGQNKQQHGAGDTH